MTHQSKGSLPLPTPDLSGFTAEQVSFAAHAWPMRAAEEFRSALVFRALAGAARGADVSAHWMRRFEGAARDEIRHAKLCAAVGERLGAPTPIHDIRPVRARLAGLPDLTRRAAALLLVEIAVGETISAGLFRAGRRGATEPLTRHALGSILRDEVGHARLGWDGIDALAPRLGDERLRDLETDLRHGFAASEQRIAVPALQRLEARTPFDPAHGALGVLDPEARVEAFYTALEESILPRLGLLGIDGDRAWRSRYGSDG